MKRLQLVLTLAATALATAAFLLGAELLEEKSYLDMEHPAIRFNMKRTTHTRVDKLDAELDAGKTRLAFDAKSGYLADLLKRLDLPADSQVLVFSRTSIQNQFISLRTPRALYFNDDTVLGYIPGAEELEFTSLDPTLGVQPYTLDADKGLKQSFARRDDCLRCHMGNATLGTPGMLVSSVHPATGDERASHGAAFLTDQDTPFAERWGGWFVTGRAGKMEHYGNSATLVNPLNPGKLSTDPRFNLMNVSDKFESQLYPMGTSDIVALMTLEHQVRMTNILVRIGWDARVHEYDKKSLDDMDWEFDEAVRYMLFAGSPGLPSPVEGSSTFQKTFPARGPKDPQGRSLRDFDLKTRLFKYPLSYMIYSEAFDNLPASARNKVYQKIDNILKGNGGDKYAYLTETDRKAVREILTATKKQLPPSWGN